jgi:hypothetical protein
MIMAENIWQELATLLFAMISENRLFLLGILNIV